MPALLEHQPAKLTGGGSHHAASNGGPVPLNPGNPYIGSKTQNGFGAFGQPDIAATLVAVAGKAIREVWYQKWRARLRHRPESGGNQ